MDLIIGANVRFTKEGGLVGSVKETISYGANTFMIYTGPTQSTMRSSLDEKNIYEGYKLMLENNINPDNLIVHSPYIVNLANMEDKDRNKFYINFLIEELKRCNTLGINKIVLHPGSATTCTKEEAISNIAVSLNEIIKKTKSVIILLEFMAGKGNEVGSNIGELKSIIDKIEDKSRIGVCIDTCHMNDSGIDLNEFDTFLNEFDSSIGLDKLKCIHVNDSLNAVGSHKDRHANIGYGTITFATLLNVISNPRVKDIPLILETPYINRNTSEECAPYKYEIDNFKNKKFTSFM